MTGFKERAKSLAEPTESASRDILLFFYILNKKAGVTTHNRQENNNMNNDNIEQEEKQEDLQYTFMNHVARKKLNLSMIEYCLADSIYHLSNNPKYNGWCIASHSYLADFLGIARETVTRAIKKLIDLGLVQGDNGNYATKLKTTQKWYDNAIINKDVTKCVGDVINNHIECDKKSHNKDSIKINKERNDFQSSEKKKEKEISKQPIPDWVTAELVKLKDKCNRRSKVAV